TAWSPALNAENLDTARKIARTIEEATDHRVRIKVETMEGETKPADLFKAVVSGEVAMVHSVASHWADKHPATPFFASVPFGLTSIELEGWLTAGGGLALWRELYAGFGLVPFVAGNTGMSMAGWYRKKVKNVESFLQMRIHCTGLAAKVVKWLGGHPKELPVAQLAQALKSGELDAVAWGGPSRDMALGLHKVAGFYHSPGWQDPGTNLELIINKKLFDSLPPDLGEIIALACDRASREHLANSMVRDMAAMKQLASNPDLYVGALPVPVLNQLVVTSEAVVKEAAGTDALGRRILDSYTAFRDQVRQWQDVSEQPFLEARGMNG
ncbi:MAG: ABC transporter substrate-binding protein, partial [Magnetococcales bacterium]|nr:ABC transporter substrate-binding protein [Magnetococcales bacterium]